MSDSRPFADLDTRRFLRLLGIVAGVGLLLRLLVCWELAGTPAVADPLKVTDMATYKRIALEILDDRWPTHFYYQPLYYALYLPIVYLLTGQSVWGVLLVQSLLGAGTVWLVGLSAARLFGRRAGLVAAALLSLARFPIFYTPFLLMATLQGFWLALLFWLAVQSWQRPVWWRWLLVALVASLATLTRGNVLLLVPGLLVLLLWRHRRQPLLAAGLAAAFLAVLYLPQLPFSIRNYHHYGRWTGPSSAMDAVLALGNTPEAPPGGLYEPASYHEWMRRAGLPGKERVSVFRQTLAWAKAEPLAFLELKWRTFLLFWNRLEVPNNVILSHHGKESLLLKVPFLLGFVVIGSLGLFGMLLSWRGRSPLRLYLYFAVLAYCAGTVLFYVLARFRLPVVPLLCIFAGNGVVVGIERFRSASGEAGRQRRLVLVLGALFSLFLVSAGFQLYQMRCEAAATRWARPRGTRVELPDRTVIHDHGPLLEDVAGLSVQEIPPEGTLVEKRFAGVDAGEGAPAVLRVPLLRENAAQEMGFLLSGCTMRGKANWKRDVLGFDWVEIPIALGKVEEGSTALSIRIGSRTGTAGMLFDQCRRYGRTHAHTPQGQVVETFEAAFELVLPKTGPPAADHSP